MRMLILSDSLAIILLCSHLGLSTNPDPAPFTLKDWNPLARKLQAASLRPGELLGMTAAEIQGQVEVSEAEAARAAVLLQRASTATAELKRLASLGIHALTRNDEQYPPRCRQRLKESAPTVLFYAGESALLGQPGIAVVGSRCLDKAGQVCAEFVGNACALSGLVLFSGGAKGVDTISMNAALKAHGKAVGILADSLEKAVRDSGTRAALARGNLCLATPYSPNAPFSVGSAMGRNRLIYAIADFAIVVASDVEKGGTWIGATEALKAKWAPVFILDHPAMPEGNQQLLQKGGLSFPHPFSGQRDNLREWLTEHAAQVKPEPYQPGLF